ncbi:unnamed protein product, partial [Didymodactylos carnosus]
NAAAATDNNGDSKVGHKAACITISTNDEGSINMSTEADTLVHSTADVWPHIEELIVPEQNGLSLLVTTSAVTSYTTANHEYPMLKNTVTETTDIVGATVSKQSDLPIRTITKRNLDMKVNSFICENVSSMLQFPSIVMTITDLARSSSHMLKTQRDPIIRDLVIGGVLKKDNFFASMNNSKKIRLWPGYAKLLPEKDDEESRLKFREILGKYGLDLSSYESFFSSIGSCLSTSTRFMFSESTAELMKMDCYRHLKYDDTQILYPYDVTAIEHAAELQAGVNVTGARQTTELRY